MPTYKYSRISASCGVAPCWPLESMRVDNGASRFASLFRTLIQICTNRSELDRWPILTWNIRSSERKKGRKTDGWVEKEREGFSRPSPTRSPGAPPIDSLLFLRSSFIYTQLYLFRLTSALRGSQPITYALLTRTPSTSHGSHLHLHLPSSSPFSPSLPLLFPPLISNPFHSSTPPPLPSSSFLTPHHCLLF